MKEGQNAAVLFVYIGIKVRMRRIVGTELPLILWIWSVYVMLSAGAREYMNVCVYVCMCVFSVFGDLIMRQHVTLHLFNINTVFRILCYTLKLLVEME